MCAGVTSATPADYKSLKQWVLAACGVLGGAITHLVWDAFTHEGARGVRMFPALEDRRSRSAAIDLTGAAFASGRELVGRMIIVVVAIVLYGLRRGQAAASRPRCAAWRGERWALDWRLFALTAAALSSLFFVVRHPSRPDAMAWRCRSAARRSPCCAASRQPLLAQRCAQYTPSHVPL